MTAPAARGRVAAAGLVVFAAAAVAAIVLLLAGRDPGRGSSGRPGPEPGAAPGAAASAAEAASPGRRAPGEAAEPAALRDSVGPPATPPPIEAGGAAPRPGAPGVVPPGAGAGAAGAAADGPPGLPPGPDEVIASAARPRAPRALEPRWGAGDSWIVHTWFRQMQTPGGGWSRLPTRFRYRVTDETVFEGVECYEVTVEILASDDLPAEDFPPERFYVERRGYALVGLSRQSREGGKWVPRTYRFAGGERSARHTSVPFDLPGAGAPGALAPGDDPFATLRFSEPGAPRSRPEEILGAGGDYIEVAFDAPDGPVRQRWSIQDLRWPAESVSAEARSYRMK